jgi:two-component system response regulator AtoC
MLRDEAPTPGSAPTSGGGPGASPAPESAFLLVFDGGSATRFTLPGRGRVLVGRASGADLKLASSSVSRRHAVLTLDGDERLIEDLDSHNGVSVNGEKVTGTGSLRPFDVIAIGDVTAVLYAPPRPPRAARRSVSRAAFRRAVEKALRLGHPFSVVAAALPPDDVARDRLLRSVPDACVVHAGGASCLVLAPAADAASAARALHAATGARVGGATFPRDGDRPDALVDRALAGVDALFAPMRLELGEVGVLVADPAMRKVYALIEQLAAVDLPVLIGGETGTGKELAASALHHWSRRRDQPFVAMNCAALPEGLVESELFGAARGAFSGAVAAKSGLLEAAHGGTLFLDEVGELPLAVQAKLLRVLETHRVRRVGDVREREVDLRIVAASHRDLEDQIRDGRFREDLFFRLSAATVWLPPLRARAGEIPLLATELLERAATRFGRPGLTLAPAALRALVDYRWPGNVRELKNVIEYVAATTRSAEIVPGDLPDRVRREAAEDRAGAEARAPRFRPLGAELKELERQRILAALEECGGNQTRAAALLHMPRRTFLDKLKQHGLTQRRTYR